MKYRTNVVKVSGDTISVSYEVASRSPIPTRTKFRRRRLLRIVRAAAFKVARDAACSTASGVIQVCRDTAQRYAHLRT
jgi:hypothetical protein